MNRLDHILVFNSLDKQAIRKISALEIAKLQARIKMQEIIVTFDKKVIDFIAEKSSALNQGARLVRKNIQELLENPLAEAIIYSRVKNGRIAVKVEKGKIKLT